MREHRLRFRGVAAAVAGAAFVLAAFSAMAAPSEDGAAKRVRVNVVEQVMTSPNAGGAATAPDLAYKYSEKPMDELGYVSQNYNQTNARPGKRLVAEPVYFSKRPLYVKAKLGDLEYIVAMDESRGTGTGYDTLYFDANRNLDLTDDPKTMALPDEDPNSNGFPVIALTASAGGKTMPYHVKPQTYMYNEADLRLYSACYREGTVTLDGKQYKAQLFDGNMNGVFNDLYVEPRGVTTSDGVYTQGDTLLLDLDGDAKLKNNYYGGPEIFHLGKHLSLGKKCYDLSVEPDGSRVTLTKTNAELGYLVTSNAGASVEFVSKDGSLKVQGKKTSVPAGTYKFVSCAFDAKDKDGATWRILGRGFLEQAKTLEVTPGRKTKVVLGPPLTATLSLKQGEAYAFNLAIEGAGGEKYSAGNFQVLGKGGQAPPPKMRIVDKTGKQVASGSFEYG